jgi:uncharacterized membrane protein
MSHGVASPAISKSSLSKNSLRQEHLAMIAAQYPKKQLESHYIIQPNRSLSWRGTLAFFAAAATVTLTVAVLFALQGAWLIVPFAGLEIIALGTCLYLCARKNSEREVILIDEQSVKVEKGRKKVLHSVEFQRHWTQVKLTRSQRPWYPSRLTISSMGKEVEVGSTLIDEERATLARELRRKLTE